MTKLLSLGHQRLLMIAVLAVAFLLVASTAFGALTFTNDDVTSDEDITITGVVDAANSIYVHANGGTSETIKVHADLGTGVASVELLSDVGGVTVTGGVASADAVNIVASNAAGGIDIDSGTGGIIADSTGVVSIDGADDMNFTLASGVAAEDLTIAVTGAFDSSVIINSSGTGTDAIGIHATAGGIDIDTASTAAAALDIDATGTVAGNAITINTTDGGIAIGAAGADNGDLTLTVGDDYVANITGIWDVNVTGAGTVDALSLSLDATTASNLTVTGAGQDLTLASVLGSVAISSTEDAASAVSITANGGTSETIVVTNTQGTGAAAIALTASAGGLTLTSNLATADGINLTATGGGLDLDATLGATLDVVTFLSFDVTAATAASNISVAANADAEDLTIAVTGSAGDLLLSSVDELDLTTTGTAAGALDINATGTVAGNAITVDTTDGGIAIGAAGADNGDLTLTVGDDYVANITGIWDVNVTGAGTVDAASLSLDATTASNLTVTGAGQDLTLASVLGSVAISSTEDVANAIYIRENGGTSGTVKIHADLGTSATEGAASVQLTSDVGGINLLSGLNAAGAIRLTADAGTSETIIIHADQGTGLASIELLSGAGGIALHAGKGVTIGGAAATEATAGAVTYTDAQMCGALINRDPNGAGRTDTTRTAAQLIAACVPTIGDSHSVLIQNTADGAEAITIAAGASVELLEPDGQNVVIEQNNWARLTFMNIDGTVVAAWVDEFIDAD